MIICHEALFWNHGDHTDWLEEQNNLVYREKEELLKQHGIVVNAVFWFIRLSLVEVGYFQGVKFITRFGEKINAFTEAASILGLTVVGCLIPSVVKLVCGLNFTSGDVILSVQEQIDSIMPSLLPVAAVGIMYYLVKVKKIKMNYIILGTLVISMVGAAFGIFTV